MARLPSEQYLIQQIGNDVVLYEEHTENEVVRYPVNDADATAKAQQRIAIDAGLSAEDKCFAHFWCGYFYANSSS
jgi:isopentenyldiphosphate isomerase